jgi:hypothetical protein
MVPRNPPFARRLIGLHAEQQFQPDGLNLTFDGTSACGTDCDADVTHHLLHIYLQIKSPLSTPLLSLDNALHPRDVFPCVLLVIKLYSTNLIALTCGLPYVQQLQMPLLPLTLHLPYSSAQPLLGKKSASVVVE